MSLWDRVAFLGFLTVVRTTNGADAVACVLGGSCILPCSFPPGGEELLHWIQQVEPERTVHSFYRGQNQLELQDPAFRGRTSLIGDQIPGTRNASLQLTGVQVQDQGRFRCYTSTSTGTKESFYQLNVYAPVCKVDMQQLEDRITCSSQGVYPEPTLTWTSNPPSNETLQNRTSVQRTGQQLYSISSSLEDPDPGLDYSCTVSTALSHRTATWFRPTSIGGSHTEATITCRSSDRPPTGLTWRFNHSQVILNWNGTNFTVSEAWRPHVKIGSEPTNLTLEALSPWQEGLYSCELHDAEESFTSSFSLRLEAADSPHHAGAVAGGVIGAFGAIVIGFIIYYKCRKKKSPSNGQPESQEMGELMTSPERRDGGGGGR